MKIKNKKIKMKRNSIICKDTGGELYPEQVGSYQLYGNKKIPFTKEEMSKIKFIEELTEMTNEIDIEGNVTIDFKEFILLMARKMRDYDNEDEYIEAFRIFDKNNDDLISKEEFKEAMTIIGQFVWGESPTDADIEYMIKEADTDGDGFLHYSDFIRKIKSIH